MKSAKSILSIIMCLSVLFMSTACDSDSKIESNATDQASQTTAPFSEATPSTDDTAKKIEKYDYVKINEESDNLILAFDNAVAKNKFKGSV